MVGLLLGSGDHDALAVTREGAETSSPIVCVPEESPGLHTFASPDRFQHDLARVRGPFTDELYTFQSGRINQNHLRIVWTQGYMRSSIT